MAKKKKTQITKLVPTSKKLRSQSDRTVSNKSLLKKVGGLYKKNQTKIKIGIFAAVILGLLYFYKDLFVAAMVNNQPVGRLTVVRELEKRQGKDTLENLITETLILQEAKKKGLVVSESEVDEQIKKIEENLSSQGTTLDNALSMQGMTREDLVKQIKLQKYIEKLLSEKIQVSENDIEDYIKENKTAFNESMTQDQIKEQAKTQLFNIKLGQEFQTWITDLKNNAKINYYVKY